MKKNKALLVDTNFSSIPIYEYLIEQGLEVFIIGNNKNDFMAKNFPNFINEDYCNETKLKEIIKKLEIDFVIPGCNDHSYQACSNLNDKSSKNIDTSKKTHLLFNKESFKNFAKKNNLPVPMNYSLSEVLEEKEISELIIKPADSFSGKGISRVNNKNKKNIKNLILYAQEFSKEKNYVIEDFVEGNLYSHSAFIENSKIVKDFIVNEYSSVNPFVVDTSYVNFNFPQEILEKIRKNIEKMASLLNLSNGLIHTQFIRKKNNFWFIEITRRCPGDLYSQLIELTTGYPYAAKYTSYFINKNIHGATLKTKKQKIIRHTITQNKNGIYYSTNYKKKLNIVKEINISITGDYLEPSPQGRVKVVFIQSKNKNELISIKKQILSKDLYKIKFINTDKDKNHE